MARIGIGIALAVVVGWFMFGRGDDAEAVTACIEKAGAAVTESPRFGHVFPYAIALRRSDNVQSYPELEGAHFYFVIYGSDRAMLFLGKGDDEAEAFEGTLRSLAAQNGDTVQARRAGKTLLVWEHPTAWPSIDGCIR
jgi:hypothetical protein